MSETPPQKPQKEVQERPFYLGGEAPGPATDDTAPWLRAQETTVAPRPFYTDPAAMPPGAPTRPDRPIYPTAKEHIEAVAPPRIDLSGLRMADNAPSFRAYAAEGTPGIVEGLRQSKEALEATLLREIGNFERQTGLRVDMIDLERIGRTGYAAKDVIVSAVQVIVIL